MSQTALKKFFWESGFSDFQRNRNDAKQKLVIWPPFGNGNFWGIFFVCVCVLEYDCCLVYKYRV